MRVLITGGSGSLGQALTRFYLGRGDRVIVYSRDEFKQAAMRQEFAWAGDTLDFHLGDVRDLARLHLSFEARPDVVIHAAALKRVDSTHHDPDELVKTNVLGSKNVLTAARGKVAKVLLISSDKACYPTNCYGRTKAIAEDYFRHNLAVNLDASIIRYGNVLGSRGSVARHWSTLAAARLPLELTDTRMTRFVLTLQQAVAQVQDALEAPPGYTYVPHNLPAMQLIDLARAIAPSGDVVVTGLRPGGEKLHETLVTDEEAVEWDRPPLRSDRNFGYLDIKDLQSLLKEEGL